MPGFYCEFWANVGAVEIEALPRHGRDWLEKSTNDLGYGRFRINAVDGRSRSG